MLFMAIFTLTLGTHKSKAEGKKSYCNNQSTIIMLIDRTTAYDDRDVETLTNGLEVIFNDLQIGDRFVVQTIAGTLTESTRVFDECVPGCLDAGVWEWAIGSCRAAVAKSDNREFRIKLTSVLRNILAEKQSHKFSEIARTIAETAKFYQNKGLKHLIIFSDMLENSTILPWNSLRIMKPSKVIDLLQREGIMPKLTGTKVDVFGFGRNHDVSRKALPTDLQRRLEIIWRDFFVSGNAKDISIGWWYSSGAAGN
jgi:hypothetical protein